MNPVRPMKSSLFSLTASTALGTAGFSLIEGWNAFGTLDLRAVPLTTVGFKESLKLRRDGMAFTIVLRQESVLGNLERVAAEAAHV